MKKHERETKYVFKLRWSREEIMLQGSNMNVNFIMLQLL